MTGYRWLWVAWLASFCALEFTALGRHRPKDTLSDFVWWICKATPGQTITHWTAIHLFVACFLGWLFFHIVFVLYRG